MRKFKIVKSKLKIICLVILFVISLIISISTPILFPYLIIIIIIKVKYFIGITLLENGLNYKGKSINYNNIKEVNVLNEGLNSPVTELEIVLLKRVLFHGRTLNIKIKEEELINILNFLQEKNLQINRNKRKNINIKKNIINVTFVILPFLAYFFYPLSLENKIHLNDYGLENIEIVYIRQSILLPERLPLDWDIYGEGVSMEYIANKIEREKSQLRKGIALRYTYDFIELRNIENEDLTKSIFSLLEDKKIRRKKYRMYYYTEYDYSQPQYTRMLIHYYNDESERIENSFIEIYAGGSEVRIDDRTYKIYGDAIDTNEIFEIIRNEANRL